MKYIKVENEKDLNIEWLCAVIKNWIIVQCNSRDLIGLAAMVYEPVYHAQEIATIKFSVYSCKRNQQDLAMLLGCF